MTLTIQLLSICTTLISKHLLPANQYMIYYLMQIETDLQKCQRLCASEWIVSVKYTELENENIEQFI